LREYFKQHLRVYTAIVIIINQHQWYRRNHSKCTRQHTHTFSHTNFNPNTHAKCGA